MTRDDYRRILLDVFKANDIKYVNDNFRNPIKAYRSYIAELQKNDANVDISDAFDFYEEFISCVLDASVDSSGQQYSKDGDFGKSWANTFAQLKKDNGDFSKFDYTVFEVAGGPEPNSIYDVDDNSEAAEAMAEADPVEDYPEEENISDSDIHSEKSDKNKSHKQKSENSDDMQQSVRYDQPIMSQSSGNMSDTERAYRNMYDLGQITEDQMKQGIAMINLATIIKDANSKMYALSDVAYYMGRDTHNHIRRSDRKLLAEFDALNAERGFIRKKLESNMNRHLNELTDNISIAASNGLDELSNKKKSGFVGVNFFKGMASVITDSTFISKIRNKLDDALKSENRQKIRDKDETEATKKAVESVSEERGTTSKFTDKFKQFISIPATKIRDLAEHISGLDKVRDEYESQRSDELDTHMDDHTMSVDENGYEEHDFDNYEPETEYDSGFEAAEPEAAEPEAAEPEAAEPEAAEPEAAEPEAAEPEATEPEATEPEATEPEATEPEATEPEATEPEAAEPEATEPEATEPEAAEPEATEPEMTEPEMTEPEVIDDYSERMSGVMIASRQHVDTMVVGESNKGPVTMHDQMKDAFKNADPDDYLNEQNNGGVEVP